MNDKSKVENNRNTGKPKGLPKSGGRQAGTLNKKSVWLREELERAGINWGKEFKKAFDEADIKKAEILCNLLPYLNPKLKDKESEEVETESSFEKSSNDLAISESLLKIIK